MPRRKTTSETPATETPATAPVNGQELLPTAPTYNAQNIGAITDPDTLSVALTEVFHLGDDAVALVAETLPEGARVTQSIMDEYGDRDFTVEQAQTLEPLAQTVGIVGRRSWQGINNVGKLLHFAKATTGHGNWEFYVTERVGLTMATAQRYMAATMAVLVYPQLQEVAHNLGSTALAKIGQSKLTTPEKVEKIHDFAMGTEATVENVTDMLNEDRPEPVRKPKELPFVPVTRAEAIGVLTGMGEAMAAVNEVIAKRIDGKAARNHPAYRDYAKAVFNDPQSDFQRSLRDFFVSAWVMAYSYENPSDATMEEFGPPIPAALDNRPPRTPTETANQGVNEIEAFSKRQDWERLAEEITARYADNPDNEGMYHAMAEGYKSIYGEYPEEYSVDYNEPEKGPEPETIPAE